MHDVRNGFITLIIMLENDEAMVWSMSVRTFGDMFPPLFVLCDVRAMYAPHTEVRNFLDSKGENLTPHSSHLIMMTLSTNIYEDAEDTKAAENILRDIIVAGRQASIASIHQQQNSSTTGNIAAASAPIRSIRVTSTDKVAQNVSIRFKYLEKKLTGDIDEFWQEFVDEYRQMAREYGLSYKQKLHYLQKMLRGDAKSFYLDFF